MRLTVEETAILYQALHMWKNHIETRNVNLSAKDAINCGNPERCRRIMPEQEEFIIKLEDLASKLMAN